MNKIYDYGIIIFVKTAFKSIFVLSLALWPVLWNFSAGSSYKLAPPSPLGQTAEVIETRVWADLGPSVIASEDPAFSEKLLFQSEEIDFQELRKQVRRRDWVDSESEEMQSVIREKTEMFALEEELVYGGTAAIVVNGKTVPVTRFIYGGRVFFVSNLIIVRTGSERFFNLLGNILSNLDDDIVTEPVQVFILPVSGSSQLVENQGAVIGVNQTLLDQMKKERKNETNMNLLKVILGFSLETSLRKASGLFSEENLKKKEVESWVQMNSLGFMHQSLERLQELARVNPLFKKEVVLNSIEKKLRSITLEEPLSYFEWLRDNWGREYPVGDTGRKIKLGDYLIRLYNHGFLLVFDFYTLTNFQIPPADIGTTMENILQAVESLPPWFVLKRGIAERDLVPLHISYDPSGGEFGRSQIVHTILLSRPQSLEVNVNEPSGAKRTFLHELAHFRWESSLSIGGKRRVKEAFERFKEKVGLKNDENVPSVLSEIIAYTAQGGNISDFIQYLINFGAEIEIEVFSPEYEAAVNELGQAISAALKEFIFRNTQDSSEDGTQVYVWPVFRSGRIEFITGRLKRREDRSWVEVAEDSAQTPVVGREIQDAVPQPPIEAAI